MKHISTLYWKRFHLFSLLVLLIGSLSAGAQVNIAPNGSVMQSNTPPAGYLTGLYIDNPNPATIPAYNAPGTGNFSFALNGGWIKFYWPFIQTGISKIVLYKDIRPLVSGVIERWDNLNSEWDTIAYYNNYQNNIVDSILFDPVSTDTIRLSGLNIGLSGIYANPTHREIQIWSMPDCSGAPPANNISPSSATACFGTKAYLNALSINSTGGHAYQWERATTATGPWTPIPGATGAGLEVDVFNTFWVRVIDTCLISNTYGASNPVQVSVTSGSAVTPINTFPYFQNFQSWISSACVTAPIARDIPGTGWSNNFTSGYNSWRIDSASTATSGQTNISTGMPPAHPNPWPAGPQRARARTSQMFVSTAASLDLHLDLSAQGGNSQMYFYMLNQSSAIGGDSLRILMSTDYGATWTRLAVYDTAGTSGTPTATDPKWRKKSVPIPSTAAHTIIRFQATRVSLNEGTDIALDSLYIVGPCSGMPNAGNINLTSPMQICPGQVFTLSPNGTTMAGSLVFTWEQSTNGCVSYVPVTGGSGFNTQVLTTPPNYDTICYRLKVRCGSDSAYTNTIVFNVAEPQYASLPFTETFNSWMTRCATSATPAPCTSCGNEVPSIYWANTPVTGAASWRRNGQGSSAAWPNAGSNTPLSSPTNSGFAQFHSSNVFPGVTGNLDLLLDASSSIGNKEATFLYFNQGPTGSDSLRVWMSTDAGGTFTKLASFGLTTGWVSQMVTIPSNAPKTILRFQGVGDQSNTGYDIGVDELVILPPCTGTPNAGVIDTVSPCPGANFTMNLSGTTQAAGLTYQWEISNNGTSFTNITGATSTSYTTSITSNTWYRVKVTCTNSNVSVYTPVMYVQLAAFYYCYCGSSAQTSLGADIGNVTILHMKPNFTQDTIITNGLHNPIINNGSATAIYTDFRYPIRPLIPMYYDSTYRFVISQINSGAFSQATVSVWIDTNRNGVFDGNERLILETTSNSGLTPNQAVDTITLPDSLPVGITGMRIMMESPANNNPTPCGLYTGGETEDYLVEIRYPQCDGPANAGTAWVSDTSSCPGYTVVVVDTTHEKARHNVFWTWEYSPDGNSWAIVPGSQQKDSIEQVITGATFFRLRVLCIKPSTSTTQGSIDTTYSNVVSVTINPPYACYCFSLADGGTADSSDMGVFSIGNYTFGINPVGPHLLNAQAYRSRTDYTKAGDVELWTNTTYPFLFYHIMRASVHHDAKITMFMDFNNDLQYNITPTYSERIFTGYATASNFTVTGNITIPPYAIPNVKTGMRVIINNNTDPNIPSDSACGPYTSGETEDFVVIFRDSSLSVPHTGNISQLYVYPNPTEGRFSITFTALKAVDQAVVTITNIMGQKIREIEYGNAGREFTREIDLSGMAKGVYLVELRADNERLVRKVIVR